MFISRQKALKILLGSLFALPVLAKNKPARRTEVAEFLESHRRSRTYTLSVFDQMPREQMGFKPLPEMFSFQRHFTHCIEFTAGQLVVRLGVKNPFVGAEWDKLTKAETRQELVRFYDWVEKNVENATPEQRAKMGDFATDQVDLLRLLYICENHLIHHRGTTMVYLRMCNIVPLGYVGW